jgi:2-polyprenyl-3-methyl-5-hydroxy-6-metoxy-1,4-benzoquinol methylase
VSRAEQLDAQSSLDAKRFSEYERLFDRAWMLEQCSARIARPGLRVCDVGGATGVFLDSLAQRAAHLFEGTIFEVDARHREHVVSSDLRFLNGSILDNDVPDASYDIVTFAHVLHHLGTDSAAGSHALQQRALGELLRITRPGGYLIFEEQVNRVKPFARIVYELSRWANALGLQWSFFEAGTVVVRFMTPAEIETCLADQAASGRARIETRHFTPWQMPWRWKLTLLMARVGASGYVVERP